MSKPSRDEVLEAAKQCGAFADALFAGRHDNTVFTSSELQQFAAAMYAAGAESAKSGGWRQCAVGQHTSQFCGQLEAEKAKAYAAGEEAMRERAADEADDMLGREADEIADAIHALPITTSTEGEQG